MLLDGFKALNQNNMKNTGEGGADETVAGVDITQVGKNEEESAFQNFQAMKPKKQVVDYPMMKHIFSVYK